MKSKTPGTDTSTVEISNIGRHGMWICVGDAEYFMSYEEFPWFRDAKVKDILDVQLLHGHHPHWPRLDVDLGIDCLANPSRYPLISS
jgi:hypothetical protein